LDSLHRWGFKEGQGTLMGATLGELPVPRAVASMLSGTEPDRAAENAAADVRSIQTSLR
jgi:multiple sugar transport system substrate-binding protein